MIYCQVTRDESAKLGHHVITRFLQDYKIRLRTKQRVKKQSKASRLQCIRPLKAKYDPKCGFLLIQRLNIDQCPLPFVVNSKKT